MSTKRAADDSTNDERNSKAAKPTEPLKVYIVMSEEKHSREGTETKMHGVYSCLATANNAARALFPVSCFDDEDDCDYYEAPSGGKTPGIPFGASYMPDKYTTESVWVDEKIVNEEIEDERDAAEDEDEDEDET